MNASESELLINFSALNDCKYYAKLDASPFSCGSFRWAFKGMLYGESGQEPRHNTRCVIKIFIDWRLNTFENCCFDLKASVKAQEDAVIFNNLTNSNTVEFLIPLVAKIDNITGPSSYFTIGSHVSIESFLDGTYQKFNSNHGWEDRLHPLMSAFSHWTWEFSSSLHMVCDLQGVYTGEKYILTYPAIHSNNRDFGKTDLGPDGMELVNKNHHCNSKCRQVCRLIIQGNIICSGPRSSTYDFQLPLVLRPSSNQQIPMTTQPTLIAPFPHNMLPFGLPNSTTSPTTQQQTLTSMFPHIQYPFGLPTYMQTLAVSSPYNQHPFSMPNLTRLNPMTNLQTPTVSFPHNQLPFGLPNFTPFYPMPL